VFQQPICTLIALCHLHIGALQSLDEDVALARALPSIALVLGGHEHVPFAQMEGGALIFKTGQNAQWLGAVRICCLTSICMCWLFECIE
jgi:2',3'-cyclic-nucleotide 2'-phosphodiesterase (5'-nucleotidase family)